jgi:hypothetical protein
VFKRPMSPCCCNGRSIAPRTHEFNGARAQISIFVIDFRRSRIWLVRAAGSTSRWPGTRDSSVPALLPAVECEWGHRYRTPNDRRICKNITCLVGAHIRGCGQRAGLRGTHLADRSVDVVSSRQHPRSNDQESISHKCNHAPAEFVDFLTRIRAKLPFVLYNLSRLHPQF